ncbi:MAG: ribonuclease HII [Clostridia bacterium]|nr:ribonuclease HII [Clostridia bacterium]
MVPRLTKEEEAKRLLSMWDIENTLFSEDYDIIAGVDEAGRGPLAGDVYAAAVILPKGLIIEGLNDSKKISEKKRDILYDVIKEKAVAWAVATASVDEIDEYNIRNATYMAMNRALSDLKTKIDYVLVDGDCIKDCKYPYSCVVKGDSKSASISAASILAKVTRDRYMLQLAEKYPRYQFEKHKGYGTALHIEMLKKYGVSPVHRKTFIKKFV